MMSIDPEAHVFDPNSTFFTALLDSGADVTVIADSNWPRKWPRTWQSNIITGVGGAEVPTSKSRFPVELALLGRDGMIERRVFITPTIAPVTGSIIGRDVLPVFGFQLTNSFGSQSTNLC